MAKDPLNPLARRRHTEARLVLAEDLLHAGADPADLDDEWLLGGPSGFGRLLNGS